MSITKTAKNIRITVKENYNLMVGGKMEKFANQVNIEATEENLTLISNNKINMRSNKK
ncbi:hypothetical protein [Flavobacterium oreochromis]|uniref:Auto-transporter adhesin head GIN domain-containing protein n=1 Tax=Flavobacterium oreochromis TaxID=2906078 RepID=A0ABW8P422_9FLAO|nr:hypothetical protein [Flavobacterium oreochromis]